MGYARKMRCAVLAALPFPLPQGSQVYVAGQAQALARAGADVTLLCYGHGLRGDGEDDGSNMLRTVEAAGVTLAPAPAGLSRTRLASGPSLRKPLADAALLAKLLAEHRRRRFDAVLAHNVEACAVALMARAATGLPVVYVAHTLFGEELSTYLPRWLARSASELGHQPRPPHGARRRRRGDPVRGSRDAAAGRGPGPRAAHRAVARSRAGAGAGRPWRPRAAATVSSPAASPSMPATSTPIRIWRCWRRPRVASVMAVSSR